VNVDIVYEKGNIYYVFVIIYFIVYVYTN